MKIAIVGATGEVGRMMMQNLAEFNVPVGKLDLYASARSEGETLYFGDEPLTVQRLTENALLQHYDYVLFSAGAGVARTYAPIALASCELIIDNSSAFRREDNIPLVVPEVNGELLQGYSGIVANPNCSTIQMILPLAVLDGLFDLRKVVVSTYQSVSGSGHTGISTLNSQRAGDRDKGAYPEIIDLNVIPQIGGFQDSGYSQEEEKMHQESRKILSKDHLQICATTVRVPVMYGHSVSVYAEFSAPVDLARAEKAMQHAKSIVYSPNTYMTPLGLGTANDSFVSRLRMGTDDHSVAFWNVANNVRLGAATNAVRILMQHLAYAKGEAYAH